MLKYFLLFLLFSSFNLIIIAQGRYEAEVFDEVLVETATYSTKDGQNLDMDIYLPQNDSELERATIIFVHGGGFQEGNRDNERIKQFSNRLASYGYVVASISYRLTRKDKPGGFGCECPANEKLNTFYAAIEDVQDATFFLIENRHQYAINPQKIILAGSSAGAEAVLQTAYQPPYCYGLESGPVSFAGVIGMAGAISDSSSLYDESAIPSLLFHGTDDTLVPYGTAPHHFCDKNSPGYLILYGSHSIAKKLNTLEMPYWLHTSCGAGHEMANKPLEDYFDVIIEFCNTFVIKENGDQRHTIVKGSQKNEFETFNFCSE